MTLVAKYPSTEELILEAGINGVVVSLSPVKGQIRLKGTSDAVEGWRPVFAERKAEILTLLQRQDLGGEFELSGFHRLDGHKVSRIVWQTEHAIVFADPVGDYWRYLFSYRQAWRVFVS